MRRPFRIHSSFVASLTGSLIALAAPVSAATALIGGAMVMVGCDDPKSTEWQLKHLTDANALERGKALDGISQQWRTLDQGSDAAAKKAFLDQTIDKLAEAYKSDTLKDSSKDRKKIMDILSTADDKRAKPAFIHALKSYKATENEDEVKSAARALLKNKDLFKGDDEIGNALVDGLKRVKFANRASGELGAMFGDILAGIKSKASVNALLSIVTSPNSGEDTNEKKELSGQQAIAAQALGEIGDASVVPQLVDTMFDLASRMMKKVDASGGGEVEKASPLTTGVSMTISNALAKLGEPAVKPLMPYVLDDDSADPKVKEVREKFKNYISPGGGGKPTAYVDIATQTVANIGLPSVAEAVTGRAVDKKTKESDRKSLVGLMVSLPTTDNTRKAVMDAYDVSSEKTTKSLIAVSVARMMDPQFTPWLLKIGADAKADDDTKLNALQSALWLADKGSIGSVKDGFDKLKKSDKPNTVWTAQEATDTTCDPKTFKADDRKIGCEEHPEKKGPKGEPMLVVWQNTAPSWGDVIAESTSLLNKCDQNAGCYFTEFLAAAKEVDKLGFTKVTGPGAKSGSRAQKAMWMLATYGSEDDMVKLVNAMSNINAPTLRSFVQMALDKNLKNGSTKVADAISKLVKSARERGDETANREAAQLEPIANKLRARAGSGKK
jgi:hypothetical protein